MIESKVFLYSSLYAVFNVFGAAIMKNKLLTVKISGFREFLFFLIDPVILIALFAIFISMFFSIKLQWKLGLIKSNIMRMYLDSAR